MELRFTVWQFVRLMVHLEETPASGAAQAALLDAWRGVWTPLDAELARLAASDADAYSDMMMDRDVVIGDADAAQATAARDALQQVVADMDAQIAAGGDAELLDSLKFERRELRQLARKLGRQTESA